MKVRAIMNPRAGVRPRGVREAVERGRPSWRDYAVELTREPGHATQLAREAVAVGGDGTANEVARGLLGSPAALGIVPVGSGNGLARALRMPLQAHRALAVLEHAQRRAIDVAFLNGQLFLNVAGIGFDAAVGQSFHEHGRRGGRRGFHGYLRLCVRELRTYRPARLSIELAGRAGIDSTPFVLTFANGPQYGAGAVINPGARLDDGRLELVLFEDRVRWRALAAAVRLFLGGLDRSPAYRRLPLSSTAIVTAGEPVAVHVDGDPGPASRRVEVALSPRALELLVPESTLRAADRPFVG